MGNKSLMVIDIQNDITKNYKKIIDRINQAIDWAYAYYANKSCEVKELKDYMEGADRPVDDRLVRTGTKWRKEIWRLNARHRWYNASEKGGAMDYIRVTKDNLEKEHICCAISNNKDVQVSSKKAWLADRFEDGLVFLKSVERGKCFIEYIPAENAWNPINAPGYMYIDCLWVSGSFKGHGYSSDLLSECIKDSKEQDKKGLCILAAAKKKPFLADPKFLEYKGFDVCDEADNGIQLWYLPFEKDIEEPSFKECAKHPHIDEKGYVLYYTNQCPFNAKYVPVLEETAGLNGIPFKAVKIESRETAQNAPTPITTYALFCDGEYVTNEQMNDKKFLKLVNG